MINIINVFFNLKIEKHYLCITFVQSKCSVEMWRYSYCMHVQLMRVQYSCHWYIVEVRYFSDYLLKNWFSLFFLMSQCSDNLVVFSICKCYIFITEVIHTKKSWQVHVSPAEQNLLCMERIDNEIIIFNGTTPTGHWCSTGPSTLTSFILHLHQIIVKLPCVNFTLYL